MTFVILKRVTFAWTCAYAKISIQKPMPTLSLVLVLARSPQVNNTAVAEWRLWTVASGSSSRQCVAVCLCVMGNHLPHPRIALQNSSMHKWRGTNDAAQHKSASNSPRGLLQHTSVSVYFADFSLYVHIFSIKASVSFSWF